jgi:hypothetical protein
VLACRPKEIGDAHRDDLKERAEAQRFYNKRKAAEFRERFKEVGADATVHEGYEDD